jgi:phenylalanyl-tRNA synthetase beta chain
LKNSHLPGLADAALRNGAHDLHIFEIGRVFGGHGERPSIAVLSSGHLDAVHWKGGERPRADFYSLKGMLEAALGAVGVPMVLGQGPTGDPRFHPTRCASIVGFGAFGQIHPEVAAKTGLEPDCFIAELDLHRLEPSATAGYRPIHRHPPARRDIAVLIDENVPYSHVEEAIQVACGPALERSWLFDVYKGSGVPEGHHSLAIALQFRKAGTFTDEEANQVRDLAVAALERLGARLR